MVWFLIILATFCASVVQSAIGFGFALISVPIYLILLNSTAAVQVVIIISVIMSLPIWYKLRHDAPKRLLKWLFVGSALGFPIGIFVYLKMDLQTIKFFVAITVILVSIQNAWQLFIAGKKNKPVIVDQIAKPVLAFIGVFSGILGVAMAMPGPTLMMFLSRTSLNKNEIRAVMMAIFVFAYTGGTIMQIVFAGVSKDTWLTSAIVTPAALFGAYVGHQLSKKINEKTFKGLILLILTLTGIFMLVNS